MSFDSDVKNAFDSIRDQTRKYTVRIANDAYSSVVDLSPVDTGYFRNQWEYNPLQFPEINIVNNTEYGPMLENGTSKQAPAGMITVTVNMLNTKYGQ